MKQYIICLLVAFTSLYATAQTATDIKKLMQDGIALHDEGKPKAAIECYDKVLKIDKNNTDALYEKAFSLMSLEKYDEVITLCKKVISLNADDAILQPAYTTLGSAYDMIKQPQKAIKTYDEGIKKYPKDYMLYFNKGITLLGLEKVADAQASVEQAVRLNPKHPGSLNALGRMLYNQNKNIPAILVFSRFFSVEIKSKRAEENMVMLQQLLATNAKKTGENNISIDMNIDAAMLDKKAPNNFSDVEMQLALQSALRLTDDATTTTKNEVQQFQQKIETICKALQAGKSKNSGFYWTFFAPYLIDMHQQKQVETFAYIANLVTPTEDVITWLKAHSDEITAFSKWANTFEWQK